MTQPANLIFFQSDNHNRAVAGCYGHTYVKTPNIDRIAESGVRFANAYSTSALCCPARAAIATGRYPHQTGFWDNAIAYDGSVPSWHHRLREQGHTVVAVGKLHYRSEKDDNGFTGEIEPMHLHEGRGAVKNLLRGYGTEPPKDDGSFWKLYMTRSGAGETHYQEYDRRITAQSIGWLKRHGRGNSKPWVLYVSYISPHPPFTVPKRLYDLYPEKDMPLPKGFRPKERPEHPAMQYLRRMDGILDMTDEAALRRIAAGYFGLITHMDEQVGEVLRAAESLGLLGNTRIAYTSDHGELFGWQGIFGKKNLYEGAPAAVRARRVTRQGFTANRVARGSVPNAGRGRGGGTRTGRRIAQGRVAVAGGHGRRSAPYGFCRVPCASLQSGRLRAARRQHETDLSRGHAATTVRSGARPGRA
jgi:choline-sulfatase